LRASGTNTKRARTIGLEVSPALRRMLGALRKAAVERLTADAAAGGVAGTGTGGGGRGVGGGGHGDAVGVGVGGGDGTGAPDDRADGTRAASRTRDRPRARTRATAEHLSDSALAGLRMFDGYTAEASTARAST
jgi:hypothetical protein